MQEVIGIRIRISAVQGIRFYRITIGIYVDCIGICNVKGSIGFSDISWDLYELVSECFLNLVFW